MTVIEGFKYEASDGRGSVLHTLIVQDFAAMGAPHLAIMHSITYIRLIEPGAAESQRVAAGSYRVGVRCVVLYLQIYLTPQL